MNACNLRKLDSKGFGHFLVVGLCLVIVGVIGVFILVLSHNDAPRRLVGASTATKTSSSGTKSTNSSTTTTPSKTKTSSGGTKSTSTSKTTPAKTSSSVKKNTTSTAPTPIHYVALGDSVASGEGINYGWVYSGGDWKQTGPQNPVWEPTTNLATGVQDCHRSAKAYPYLVASATKYQLLDLSCSGATIPEGVLGAIPFDKTTTGAAQLGTTQMPNAEYDTFKPKLVTITLGMDDVDFSDVLTNCYTGACGTTSQNNSMNSAIATFSSNLKILLSDIDNRGKADGQVPWVVLTTYYNPFNLSSLNCDDINIGFGFGLSSANVTWLQSKLNLIDQDIETDSSSYPKAKVVNLSNVMNGHQFCSSDPWVYGPSILYDDLNSPAPFHPTPSGQQAIANAMLTTIKSLSL